MPPIKVLFLCTGNSCRSQMAEGLLRDVAGDRFDVFSAGTDPVAINPGAVEVMREKGIDLSHQRSKGVELFLGQHFPYVITVCDSANERCPIFPGVVTRLHWSFEDPAHAAGSAAERLAVFRRVRDEIEASVLRFVDEVERGLSLTGDLAVTRNNVPYVT
ncbi:MAG TPA: arsenate reductase ArsC [Thermoanaerobaculia bacterium]|nr:arsenate reductase ArsC [Thermoanaerobaculia bacterium]